MSEATGIKVFPGSSGRPFAKRICDYLGIEVGHTDVIQFTEGNTFVKIGEHVRGREVYIVQPIALHPNDELVELLFWLDAFKRSGAKYVTAIVPYFSYAKGDKKDEPRVSIRARVCADCIELAGADRVITMDLHAPQIQGFFKKPVDHLFAMPLLCEYVKTLKLDDLVVVSPDAGFAKNARNYAMYLDAPLAIGDKMRKDHAEKAEVLELIGHIDGMNALVVDDFSISGGTLIDLARLLKQRGAKRISVCLSHILLNEEGVKRIEESPIDLLIATDSVGNERVLGSPKIRIISVAPLFAEAIRRMDGQLPVSDLFGHVPPSVAKSSFGG